MKLLTVVLLRCKLVAWVSLSLFQGAVAKLPVSPALCQLLCHLIQLAGKLLVSYQGLVEKVVLQDPVDPFCNWTFSGAFNVERDPRSGFNLK